MEMQPLVTRDPELHNFFGQNLLEFYQMASHSWVASRFRAVTGKQGAAKVPRVQNGDSKTVMLICKHVVFMHMTQAYNDFMGLVAQLKFFKWPDRS
jgi:hypothetical protein